MSIKKVLIVTAAFVTEVVASQAAKAESTVAQSWYTKLITHWERLGANVQLGIQLALVVIAFYALTCFFKCNKKCG